MVVLSDDLEDLDSTVARRRGELVAVVVQLRIVNVAVMLSLDRYQRSGSHVVRLPPLPLASRRVAYSRGMSWSWKPKKMNEKNGKTSATKRGAKSNPQSHSSADRPRCQDKGGTPTLLCQRIWGL